jgi:hypothetical protein
VIVAAEKTLSNSTKSVQIGQNQALTIQTPKVKTSDRAVITVIGPNGKKLTLPTVAPNKSGQLTLPPIKFPSSGAFTVSIKIAGKTLTYKVMVGGKK